MQAIKQYTGAINGSIQIDLRKGFIAKRVGLVILPAGKGTPVFGSHKYFDFKGFFRR